MLNTEEKTGVQAPVEQKPVSLKETIISAYRKAVQSLSQLEGAELRQERNSLFWGCRDGSKVDGVRDAAGVERLFDSIMTPASPKAPAHAQRQIPMVSFPHKDADGNLVYCFQLSEHYAKRGWSNLGRVSDLHDMGEVFRRAISIGQDYDEATDTYTFRLQAPSVHRIQCKIVTIVMSGDNSKFIAWFCGEPKAVYDGQNIQSFVLNGQFDPSNLWVRVGHDYDQETRQKKQEIRIRRAKELRKVAEAQPQHTHRPHRPHPKRNMVVATVADAWPDHKTVGAATPRPKLEDSAECKEVLAAASAAASAEIEELANMALAPQTQPHADRVLPESQPAS